VSDSADGAAFEPVKKLSFRPTEKLEQVWPVKAVPGLKIRTGDRLSKSVPRADQLAVVTAEYSVPDQMSEFNRN
jgi:hypothetical protein